MDKLRFDDIGIITKRNVDVENNPIAIAITESKQIINASVVLREMVSEIDKVEIQGMYEVDNNEDLTIDTFKVDYTTGVIYFNPANEGFVKTIKYKGIGYTKVPCSMIYTKVNQSGEVEETLEDILNNSKVQLELVSSLGDAIVVIDTLNRNITNATNINTTLVSNITTAQELIKQLVNNTNKVINVTASQFKLVDGLYKATITHNWNTTNLVCALYDSNNRGLVPAYDIVNANQITIMSDEAINIKVVASVGIWGGIS